MKKPTTLRPVLDPGDEVITVSTSGVMTVYVVQSDGSLRAS